MDATMLFLHILTSLDGYIEDENGGIDWFRESDDFDAYILTLLGSIEGMVFGRVAHDLLATYWPTAADRPGVRPIDLETTRLMNALPKYVLTRSGGCADWSNSHPVDLEGIASLKQRSAGDIALFA
ncbi:MAG: dihydrofolate reductase family protein, partial [Alphaproteobacteria bacterium]